MLTFEIEKRLTTIVTWGALVVTLLVTDRVSMDPVNVGKMLVLAVVAGSSLVILKSLGRNLVLNLKPLMLSIVGFLFIALLSVIFSRDSWEKGFFGTYGRNTGYLTYFSLSILFIAAAQLKKTESYLRIMRVFLLAGVVNIVYCLVVVYGVDIFTWRNPYGKVLGTFGNPNFISSFMGMFFTALTALLLAGNIKYLYRISILLCAFASLFIVIKSGSQQGGVVAIGGLVIVFFFFLRSKFRKKWLSLSYLIGVILFGLISIAGMLQKGPLAGVLYKESVSLRGEYWHAGINMGLANPFLGVGLDSFGTFYRTYRNQSATIVPGVNTISDAAHNIYIDIFASTGFLGLLFFSVISVLILLEAIRFIKNNISFDPIFVFLFSTWVAYQAQSIISINQIGLAVWGWVLGGLLFGYTRSVNVGLLKVQDFDFTNLLKTKKPALNKEVPAGIALGNFLGGMVFLLFASPGFYADAVLRQATFSDSAEKLFLAAQQFPLDSNRLNYVAAQISKGGINEQSVSLVRIGLEKFPNNFDLLFSQFQISAPESPEKKEIGKRLHLADPFNPAFDEYK
jgi:O-antigen ligase